MADNMLINLLNLVDAVFAIYFWTLLAYVIAGWLAALNIVNPYNPVFRQIVQGLAALHEPILRPIRALQYRLIPNMGGFDLSPIVALLVVQYLIRPMVHQTIIGIAY